MNAEEHAEYYNKSPNRRICPKCDMPMEAVINNEGEVCIIIRHKPMCQYAYLNETSIDFLKIFVDNPNQRTEATWRICKWIRRLLSL